MDVDQNTKLDVVGDILTLLEACVVPLVIIILHKYVLIILNLYNTFFHTMCIFLSYRFMENAC